MPSNEEPTIAKNAAAPRLDTRTIEPGYQRAFRELNGPVELWHVSILPIVRPSLPHARRA